MKKRYYFFGLVLISLLLISGCQQAVGGGYPRTERSTVDTTSFTSTGKLSGGNQMKKVEIFANPGSCSLITNRVGGSYVNINSGTPIIYQKLCYVVLACGGMQIDTKYRSSIEEFVIASRQDGMFCAQQSKGVTIDLDKDGSTPLNMVFTTDF